MVVKEMENLEELHNDQPQTSSSIYASNNESRENLDYSGA